MPKPSRPNQIKLAVVYDRANTHFGGAERLLKAIGQFFPETDLFTSVTDKKAPWLKNFRHVHGSFLNKLPLARKRHQFFEPLTPLAFESFDLSSYQVVLSLSSGQSKAVLTKPHQLHLNYLLTPPRYLYRYQETYLGSDPNWRAKLLELVSLPARSYLTWFEKASSLRPDVIVPLSKLVKARAQKIYPQVKLEKPLYPFATDLRPKLKLAKKQLPKLTYLLTQLGFNLSVSRLVAYKRVDLAVKASLKLKKPLIIVGSGLDATRLARLAQDKGAIFYPPASQKSLASWLSRNLDKGKLIFFLGNVNDQVLALLYDQAQLVISLGLEDFGLVPLEAGYFGTPSVINAESGVAEVLKDKTQTLKLDHPSITSLLKILKDQRYRQIKPVELKRQTLKFSQKSYLQNLKKLMYDKLALTVSYKV